MLKPLSILARRKLFDAFHKFGKPVVAAAHLGAAYSSSAFGGSSRALKYAMSSHRLGGLSAAVGMVSADLGTRSPKLLDLVSSGVELKEAAGRSIVIRWPVLMGSTIRVKGIMIIAFTRTFSWYLRHSDVSLLTEYFHVVLEPSWSGYMDPDILGWAVLTKQRVYVQCSETTDRATLNSLCTNLYPISIGASDWVDFRRFYPKDSVKDFDVVYVANTTPIKRIHTYFATVRRIVRTTPDFRAMLVCAGLGGRQSEIESLRKFYGLELQCRAFYDVPQADLNDLLNRCKFNVLLSLKEGSNRSLFESMFANVPVVLIDSNVGVNRAYINEYTGVLGRESRLPEVFRWMADNYASFAPRRWAERNIDPSLTTEKLCSLVDYHNGASTDLIGEVFTKVNNPEPSYLDAPVSISAVHELHRRLLEGFRIGVSRAGAHAAVASCAEEFNRISVSEEESQASHKD